MVRWRFKWVDGDGSPGAARRGASLTDAQTASPLEVLAGRSSTLRSDALVL